MASEGEAVGMSEPLTPSGVDGVRKGGETLPGGRSPLIRTVSEPLTRPGDEIFDGRRGAKRLASSPLQRSEGGSALVLSDEDILALKEEIAASDVSFAQHISTSKESLAKKKDLEQIIAAYRRASDRLILAYMQMKADKEAVDKVWRMISANLNSRLGPGGMAMGVDPSVSRQSYASVAGAAGMDSKMSRPVPEEFGGVRRDPDEELEALEVAPADEDDQRFTDSASTRRAVCAAINPGEMGLKVNRIVKGRNKGIRIIAEKRELEKIKPVLSNAGLKAKRFDKLNPRLIVRDIPMDIDRGDLVKSLVQQNLKDVSPEDVKLIYWFPRKDFRTTSAVIEVRPDVRAELLKQGRIYIGWSVCRVADHLRVAQCFRCLSFGHIAKDCKATSDICGHCAGEHETRGCPDRSMLRCHNCSTAKMQSTDHSALDTNSCPILRRKINEKARHISY